jgi:hypothetical protein
VNLPAEPLGPDAGDEERRDVEQAVSETIVSAKKKAVHTSTSTDYHTPGRVLGSLGAPVVLLPCSNVPRVGDGLRGNRGCVPRSGSADGSAHRGSSRPLRLAGGDTMEHADSTRRARAKRDPS